MAILEHHPVSAHTCLLDVLLSDWSLSLSEGNGDESLTVAFLLGELEQLTCWISSGTQHEDQWNGLVQIVVDGRH